MCKRLQARKKNFSDLFARIWEKLLRPNLAISNSFDLILFEVFVIVSVYASTAHENVKNPTSCETSHHYIAPRTVPIAYKEHGGHEQVEETLSDNRPQKLEIVHNAVEIK